ncbi:MAG: beta-xylosidase [Acidimicrobiia bacterium]
MPEAPEPSRRTRRPWLDGVDILVVALVALAIGVPLALAADSPDPPSDAPCAQGGTALTAPVDDAGFAAGSGLPDRSEAGLARDLEGMAATGAGYLRFDLPWSYIEEQPGQFQWAEFDRIIAGAHACGLEVIGLLTYSPEWARAPGTGEHSPPVDVDDFAAFATEAVRRYEPEGVATWEIWNEPNIDVFWEPAPDPAAYADLLIAAYDAIEAVDPDGTVITGGLAPAGNDADGSRIAPVTFLEGVYAAGAGGHFDAVGHHPYAFPALPLDADGLDNAFADTTPGLVDVMEANRDGDKLIWGTEIGAPTSDGGISPDFLAEYATEAYDAWRAWPFTGPLLWYTYRDAGRDPADPEDNFGLVTVDYRPKEPALSAFEAVIRR